MALTFHFFKKLASLMFSSEQDSLSFSSEQASLMFSSEQASLSFFSSEQASLMFRSEQASLSFSIEQDSLIFSSEQASLNFSTEQARFSFENKKYLTHRPINNTSKFQLWTSKLLCCSTSSVCRLQFNLCCWMAFLWWFKNLKFPGYNLLQKTPFWISLRHKKNMFEICAYSQILYSKK